MAIDMRKLEEAVALFLSTKAEAVFDLESAAQSVAELMGMKRGPNKDLRKELEQILSQDHCAFFDPKNNTYGTRKAFFKGAQIRIIPTHFELKERILLPGHRFASFCHSEIVHSEITLESEGAALPMRRIKLPLEEAVAYYNLLGAEQMFEFFMTEAQENVLVMSKGLLDAPICLDVFDMKDFYASHKIKEGDSLLMSVLDWERGVFSCSKCEQPHSAEEAKSWVGRLEDALDQVCENFDNYLEIPEQLAYAFFVDKTGLLHNPAGSLDEFQSFSTRIEISLQGGRTVLAPKGEISSDAGELEIPEGIALSKGKSSPQEILKELGSPLLELEIRAFILDELFQGGSYEGFYDRCFGETKPAFVDDFQEAILLNWLEDLWELAAENYSREEDEAKGPLRAEILELVDERLLWFRDLQKGSQQVRDEFSVRFEELARIAMQLNTILDLLNSREQHLSPQDTETILETVEKAAEKQRALIDAINLALSQS